MKFIGIWIMNPLKTSGASGIGGASVFGLEVIFWPGF